MITKEIQEKNLKLFFKKLQQLGIDTQSLEETYGEEIMKGSFTNTNESGNAYEGSFLEIILKTLTPYAIKLNELLPEDKRVDRNTLIKICLLHQISKCVRLEPNDNQWEVEKRGIVFKYKSSNPSIRTGLHSLMLCINCGIYFSVSESEAMTVNDRDLTDDQARWHSSIMATIIRQASELTYLTIGGRQ